MKYIKTTVFRNWTSSNEEVIPEKEKTNEVISTVVPAYCLKKEITNCSVQRQILMASLS